MNSMITSDPMDIFNLPYTELYLIIDIRAKVDYIKSHISGSYSFTVCNNDDIETALNDIINELDSSQLMKVCIVSDTCNTLLYEYIKNNGLPNMYDTTRRNIPKSLLLMTAYDSFALMYPFLISSNCSNQYHEESIIIKSMISNDPIFFPSQITKWLYLGNKTHANDIRVIDILEITTIINITKEIPNYHEDIRKDINYIKIEADDDINTDMISFWIQIADIIESCVKMNKKTLIHCSAGRSRSASSVIYYLMKKENLSLNESYEHVLRCRDIIDPNEGFRRQLKEIESKLTL